MYYEYNCSISVYIQREAVVVIVVAAMVTVGGIVFHSSFGLSYAFSFACVLCVVHPVSLRISRVETRLEK